MPIRKGCASRFCLSSQNFFLQNRVKNTGIIKFADCCVIECKNSGGCWHVQKKVVEKNAVGIANIPRSIRQMNVAFSA